MLSAACGWSAVESGWKYPFHLQLYSIRVASQLRSLQPYFNRTSAPFFFYSGCSPFTLQLSCIYSADTAMIQHYHLHINWARKFLTLMSSFITWAVSDPQKTIKLLQEFTNLSFHFQDQTNEFIQRQEPQGPPRPGMSHVIGVCRTCACYLCMLCTTDSIATVIMK